MTDDCNAVSDKQTHSVYIFAFAHLLYCAYNLMAELIPALSVLTQLGSTAIAATIVGSAVLSGIRGSLVRVCWSSKTINRDDSVVFRMLVQQLDDIRAAAEQAARASIWAARYRHTITVCYHTRERFEIPMTSAYVNARRTVWVDPVIYGQEVIGFTLWSYAWNTTHLNDYYETELSSQVPSYLLRLKLEQLIKDKQDQQTAADVHATYTAQTQAASTAAQTASGATSASSSVTLIDPATQQTESTTDNEDWMNDHSESNSAKESVPLLHRRSAAAAASLSFVN